MGHRVHHLIHSGNKYLFSTDYVPEPRYMLKIQVYDEPCLHELTFRITLDM